jgi:uroporphyrinogen decarboxylase
VRHIDAIPVLHVCGNTSNLAEEMAATGVQGISLDAMVDLAAVAKRVPRDCVVMGNIDPVRVMVNQSPEGVRQAVRDLCEKMSAYENFILATACDLPPETPLENIVAFVDEGKRQKQPR